MSGIFFGCSPKNEFHPSFIRRRKFFIAFVRIPTKKDLPFTFMTEPLFYFTSKIIMPVFRRWSKTNKNFCCFPNGRLKSEISTGQSSFVVLSFLSCRFWRFGRHEFSTKWKYRFDFVDFFILGKTTLIWEGATKLTTTAANERFLQHRKCLWLWVGKSFKLLNLLLV